MCKKEPTRKKVLINTEVFFPSEIMCKWVYDSITLSQNSFKQVISMLSGVVNRKFTKLAQHLRYINAYIGGLTTLFEAIHYLQQFVDVLAIIHRVYY